MSAQRFLLASIGNPDPYYGTLHSAGHHVLDFLQPLLTAQPPLKRQMIGKTRSPASIRPGRWLVQSPVLMNVSGPWLARTWKAMLDTVPDPVDPKATGLILFHDELELEFGAVKILDWDRSPRGHNGVKSVKSSIERARFPGNVFARLAIGIGRPTERDHAAVSNYVLGAMSRAQVNILRDESAPAALALLKTIHGI